MYRDWLELSETIQKPLELRNVISTQDFYALNKCFPELL